MTQRESERGDTGTPSPARQPASVEDLTRRNVELVQRIEQAELERRSGMDRAIDAITAFCGSTWFVWLHIAWFGTWIVVNGMPGLPHFDEYPFQFLTLVVSLEAILLSTFILITQNRQAALADRRNHLDLQINMLSEQENTKILLLLDRIASKLGIDESNDPELQLMEEQARPERMVQQIRDRMVSDRTGGTLRGQPSGQSLAVPQPG
jgi:uncharacterized membrane protein